MGNPSVQVQQRADTRPRRGRQQTNPTVSLAQGMLMERHKITPEFASTLLHQCADENRTTVESVAAALVATRCRP